MPEHLRALVVVLLLAAPAYLISRTCLAEVVGIDNFKRRWAAWLAVTLVLFLAHDAWAYLLALLIVVTLYRRREQSPLALYLMLLFAAPPMMISIPGFGIINYLADLSHDRLLALSILLPTAIQITQKRSSERLGSTWADKVLLAYVAYVTFMQLRDTTFTDAMRSGFYLFTDVVLIYYVASRSMRETAQVREALATLVMAAMPIALCAAFELAFGWLLYSSIPGALGARSAMGGYLMRDALLRAIVTVGQSISLGYFFVIAIGAAMFTAGYMRAPLKRLQMFAMLALGLLAGLSRGPWLGALLLYLLQAALYPNFLVRVIRRLLAVTAVFLLMLTLPVGERLLAMLPYVGTVDAQNVEFREELIEAGMTVFWRSPWTGSVTYLEQPEMLPLMRDGLIDVVNTYLGIALAYGVIGLSMFLLVFALGLHRAVTTFRNPRLPSEVRSLARILAATTVSVLFIIYTVSSVNLIPHMYWLLLGSLCALPGKAYALVAEQLPAPSANRPVAST